MWKRDRERSEAGLLPQSPSLSPRQLVLARSLSSKLGATDSFPRRHIGPWHDNEVKTILKTIKADSLDALVKDTVPHDILYDAPPYSSPALGEAEALLKCKVRLPFPSPVSVLFCLPPPPPSGRARPQPPPSTVFPQT